MNRIEVGRKVNRVNGSLVTKIIEIRAVMELNRVVINIIRKKMLRIFLLRDRSACSNEPGPLIPLLLALARLTALTARIAVSAVTATSGDTVSTADWSVFFVCGAFIIS